MNDSPTILQVALPTPLWQFFDYLPPEETDNNTNWPVGIRILVPFGRKKVVGILVKVCQHSDYAQEQLKTIIEKLDDKPLLTPSLTKLCEWASDYYHYPLGEVLTNVLPKLLREGRVLLSEQLQPTPFIPTINTPSKLVLNDDQQQAISAIVQVQHFQTFLLEGVTGSGKTEVYFACIAAVLAKGQQALVLVPEIALTPQTLNRFEQHFNIPIVLLHSTLTDKARLDAWLQARAGKAAIIIGTRSAIFTPMLSPGIIIIDEEHDLSFKQQSGFRYSARDLAIVRGRLEAIPVVLGSATPSLESLYNCRIQRYQHLRLPQRAGSATLPRVHLINLRNKRLKDGLSVTLLNKIGEHIEQGGQVLLFINRRGFAPVLMCHHCGWTIQCKHCDARLTLHYEPARLFCHHCGWSTQIPQFCQKCQQSELLQIGQGTERIEQCLQTQFPEQTIVRIDKDSTRKKGSMQQLLAQAHNLEANILIGTQMLAKGHHFPKLTLVAIIEIDSGLFSSDFRALERMGQLLVQVAGRAGRVEQVGEVIIQTHHPDHPLLQLLLKKGYSHFAQSILSERQQTSLPPFSYLALLRAEANQQQLAQQFLLEAKELFEQTNSIEVDLLGPIPALMERRAGRYRAQLLLQSNQRRALQNCLQSARELLRKCKSANKVRWSLDIDPQEM